MTTQQVIGAGLFLALLVVIAVATVWSDQTYCKCGKRRVGWHPDFRHECDGERSE